MSEPLLQLDGVAKRFGALAAVEDVSVSVRAGERWAVIGPNGAGKTTLFRVISGEHTASSGTVRFDGRDVTRVAEHRRSRLGIGRTFQITELFTALTVEQNVTIAAQARSSIRVAFWRVARTTGSIGDLVRRCLDQVGLAGSEGRLVAELSHGEQRQLEIAVALAQEPRLLLLDEPAAGLSAAERRMMRDLVASLPRDLAIVLIEHDMALALGLVERVLCMDNGRPIAEGTPDEIRADELVQSVYLRS